MEKFKNMLKHCEICNSEATSLCFKCFSYFCESCFKFVHEKNFNSGHKKEEIDYFVPIDLKCPNIQKILLIYIVLMKKVINYIYNIII